MARTLQQHLAADGGAKRILSLDGGGVKGILTLGMLKAVEDELRKRSADPKLVLSDYYDLIGGTSTGAIIASGLSLGMSVDALIEMYAALGPKVFRRKRGTGLILKAQYDHNSLKKALEPVLRDVRLGDTESIKTGLSIHMKRIDTGSAWVVSNHPGSPYFEQPVGSRTIPNKYYLLSDLVRASAAAPTFFDEVVIATKFDVRQRPSEPGYFVDGAVSANNNPSLQLLLTALVEQYGFKWSPGADKLMMTSLGTGMRRPRAARTPLTFELTAIRAVSALRAMIYDTQIQNVAVMQALSKPRAPWRINAEIKDMAPGGFVGSVLDFQRMDVSLELRGEAKGDDTDVFEGGFFGFFRKRFGRSRAENLLGEAITREQLVCLDELANGDPANIDRLLRLGLAAGKEYVSKDYPNPAFDLPEWRKGPA